MGFNDILQIGWIWVKDKSIRFNRSESGSEYRYFVSFSITSQDRAIVDICAYFSETKTIISVGEKQACVSYDGQSILEI